jgi:hypothetical protein
LRISLKDLWRKKSAKDFIGADAVLPAVGQGFRSKAQGGAEAQGSAPASSLLTGTLVI